MNKARIAVLGLALVAAIGAAVLVSSLTGRESTHTVETTLMETTQVLIAAEDITLGSLIGAEHLRWQDWPRDAVTAQLVTRDGSPNAMNTFTGSIVRAPFVEGEPIIDRKVIRPDTGGFMAAILPEGMRAISVGISPETGAGGFILPNDHVDVILTRRVRVGSSSREAHVSETVLTNVRVLAIDQTFRDNGRGEQVAIGKTATVELEPDQSEVLALAEAMGDISLALRSIKDSTGLGLGENGPQAPESTLFGGRGTGSVTMMRYGVSSSVSSNQ
jgi:pilus assembly protein CpaB